MRRRSQYTEPSEDLNIWPAFTDLMSNAFLIITLLLLLSLFLREQLKSLLTPTDAPPFIELSEAEGYQFNSGSAELSPKMNAYISGTLVPKIKANANTYQINLVEVIGHTDGEANGGMSSDLDQKLEEVARNPNVSINKLSPGSNADLGLMRALAVVKKLRSIQAKDKGLKGINFRAYSAAQLFLPTGQFATINPNPDLERRRIEIRFTRLGEKQ